MFETAFANFIRVVNVRLCRFVLLHTSLYTIMAKTAAPQDQDKGSKRTKGKGKVTKEPEAPKIESPADNGFSLFKSASSKDAELDDLFSKSVSIPSVRREATAHLTSPK